MSPHPQNPRPTGDPSDRVPGLGGAVLRFFAGLLYGRYDEDKKARKNFTVAALAATMLSIIGVQWARESSRTDTLIKNTREDFQASSKATVEFAAEVRNMVAEMKETRLTLLQKIPNAAPDTKDFVVTPVGTGETPTRKRAKRPPPHDIGGIK